MGNYTGPEIWGCSSRIIPHRSESAADLFEEVAGQDLGENRRVFQPEEVRFSLGLILQNVGKVFAKHMKGKGLAPWCVGHGSSMSFRKIALDQLGGFDNRLGAGAPLRSAARTLTSITAFCDRVIASFTNRARSCVTIITG